MSLTNEAIERLEKAKQQILNNPSHFNMDTWISENDCGTVGCIAGWICINEYGTEGVTKVGDIEEKVYGLLGIDMSEEDISLFHVHDWDVDLREEYYTVERDRGLSKEQKKKQLSQIAAKAIDRYIEENQDDKD